MLEALIHRNNNLYHLILSEQKLRLHIVIHYLYKPKSMRIQKFATNFH